MTPQPGSARQVVAAGVQNLVARRLGRGFVPFAVLFSIGLAEELMRPGSGTPVLSLGAVVSGLAMLAYGLRISERAFARPHRRWMSWASIGGVVPPVFALYVLGWRGLRDISLGGAVGIGGGLTFAVLGTWALRSWMKVVEVERLARVMTMNME